MLTPFFSVAGHRRSWIPREFLLDWVRFSISCLLWLIFIHLNSGIPVMMGKSVLLSESGMRKSDIIS